MQQEFCGRVNLIGRIRRTWKPNQVTPHTTTSKRCQNFRLPGSTCNNKKFQIRGGEHKVSIDSRLQNFRLCAQSTNKKKVKQIGADGAQLDGNDDVYMSIDMHSLDFDM